MAIKTVLLSAEEMARRIPDLPAETLAVFIGKGGDVTEYRLNEEAWRAVTLEAASSLKSLPRLPSDA